MKTSIRRLVAAATVSSLSVAGLATVALATTAANDAAVVTAVSNSLKITKLPTTLTPTLAQASTDTFVKFDSKCAGLKGGCTFGKTTSKDVMYVFGDSHAQEWLAPLVGAFGSTDKINIIFRYQCQPAEVDVQPVPGTTPDTGCAAWRSSAISAIVKAKPKVIVLAESTFRLKTTDGANMSTVTWSTGLVTVFTQLKASGAKIVLIGDNPAFQVNPSSCLAQNTTNVQNCTRNPATQPVEYQVQSTAESNAASVSGVGYIDTTKWFCKVSSSQTLCPAVIGNMIPYFDWNHITLTYSKYLTTVLKAAVLKNMK